MIHDIQVGKGVASGGVGVSQHLIFGDLIGKFRVNDFHLYISAFFAKT